MKREDFETIVHRYEQLEERDPASFRRGVWLFAALGHMYFGVLAVLALTVTTAAVILLIQGQGVAIAIKLLLLALAADVALAQALWVRIPPPDGVPLEPRQALRLFEDVEYIRNKLQCPPVHRVLLTDELNASLTQHPRLGVFGWQRYTLSIGLPLLHVATRAQMRALIAHELGHLSGLHGKFGARIYRVSTMWERLSNHGETGTKVFLIRRFVRWYAPRLEARSFTLKRAQEYEADAASVAVSGVEETARLLLRIHALGADFQERLDESLFALARGGQQEPPSRIAFALAAASAELSETELDKSLERMLLEETEYSDTHPSLADRLEAIGVKVRGADAKSLLAARGLWPPKAEAPATSEYFPSGTSQVASLLDQHALEHWFADQWEILINSMEESRKRLAEIDAQRQSDPSNDDLASERVRVVESLHGPEAALQFAEGFLADHPGSLGARVQAGRLLLDVDREHGLEILGDLLGRDRVIAASARQVLYAYYRRTGQQAEARAMLGAMDEDAEVFERADKERTTITRKDVFLPHGLSEGELDALRAALEPSIEVVRVWVVQKQVKELTELRALIAVLDIKPKALIVSQESAEARVVNEMQSRLDNLPFHVVWFSAHGCPAPLRRATKRDPGALVFDRKRKRAK